MMRIDEIDKNLKIESEITEPYLIWLNPNPTPTVSNFWTTTHTDLAKFFRMYQLTAEGLEQGLKSLMARH